MEETRLSLVLRYNSRQFVCNQASTQVPRVCAGQRGGGRQVFSGGRRIASVGSRSLNRVHRTEESGGTKPLKRPAKLRSGHRYTASEVWSPAEDCGRGAGEGSRVAGDRRRCV
ncbi:unnamed protein product [Pleuronectes platessa]|uniref:Uncharacterized protein n=1 Tax=Pleuronectes platessa TaxID=8262 RepID=A0A9N7VUI8_PLEPL|nr:unnamed protein product [Pleuronectes platessa]